MAKNPNEDRAPRTVPDPVKEAVNPSIDKGKEGVPSPHDHQREVDRQSMGVQRGPLKPINEKEEARKDRARQKQEEDEATRLREQHVKETEEENEDEGE